ncbi:MAG: PQQ-dependent sugar dehydrogenase [Desulfosudaceae bacterium]
MKKSVTKIIALLTVVFAGAGLALSSESPKPEEPVIEAQPKPAGKIRTLSNGTELGGRPEMPAQYRVTEPAGIRTEKVAGNLNIPWDMEFSPDGKLLFFTERPGKVRFIRFKGQETILQTWMDTASSTLHLGEGGLMGIALHPDFGTGRMDDKGRPLDWIYLSETYGSTQDPANRIFRVRKISTPEKEELEREVLLDQIPAASYHNGSRLAFGPDGMLYATTGDAGTPSKAQELESWAGKILRLTPGGKPAPGNPFSGDGARAYVYSFGHRNPQGLAWHPETGDLYVSEHGPSGEFGLRGNDEINLIEKGGNYGWPRAVGAPGVKDLNDPILLFPDPHLPPAGMDFYTDNSIQSWKGSLFVGSLRGELLLRAGIGYSGGSPEITSIERLFEKDFFSGVYGRIRAVSAGPDGFLYFATSNRDGRGSPASDDDRIMRLVPEL